MALLKETLNARYFDVLLKIIIGGQSIESYAKENGLGVKSVYNLLARSKEAVRKNIRKFSTMVSKTTHQTVSTVEADDILDIRSFQI